MHSHSTVLFPFQDPRLHNPHLIHWPILRACFHQAHPLHDPQAPRHPAKYGVLTIQPRRGRQRDEELATIRIWSRVRHAQDPCARVLERRVDLVLEFLPVDAAPSAARACWIARL